MNDFLSTLYNSLPVFATIAVVLFLRFKGVLKKEHAEGIAPLIFKVVLPVFAFQVAYAMSLNWSDFPILVTLFLIHLAVLPLIVSLNRFTHYKKPVLGSLLLLALAYAIGPVAYPFVLFNFDQAVFSKLVAIDIMLFITVIVVGAIVAALFDNHKKVDFQKAAVALFTDPVLLAVLLGILLQSAHVELPEAVMSSSNFIATPFVFLVTVLVGLTIDKPDKKRITLLISITVARLVFAVLVSLGVILIFQPAREMALAIPLALFMAFSSFPLVYTERHNLDTELVAQASLFSRVVMLPLYPLLITVLKLLL